MYGQKDEVGTGKQDWWKSIVKMHGCSEREKEVSWSEGKG